MPVFSGTAAADRIVGSADADQIYGLAGDDKLYGAGGNDWLVGGLGDDILVGGLGDDSYDVDAAGDQVVERAGEGIDRVRASVSHQLAANVEILTLTGTADINGFGNALDNTILGNAGNNVLNGGAGNDAMTGGAGNDVYDVDSIGDVVSEGASAGYDRVRASVSYILSANVEEMNLAGVAAINGTGNALANTIVGNAGANVLTGGAGDDVLSGGGGNDVLGGGGGADRMDGGVGDDLYEVDSLGDRVAERSGEGIDSVRASVSYRLSENVETLILLGTGDLNGAGNSLNNEIAGNAGDNVLDGGWGDDVLAGGQGNDIYYVDSLSDTVVEKAGEGIDEIRTLADWFAIWLDENIENVRLLGNGGGTVDGNDLNNNIVGGGGGDMLSGRAGDDALVGGDGNDFLYGGLGKDRLYGGSGSDELGMGYDNYEDDRSNIAVGEVYDGGDGEDNFFLHGDSAASIDLTKIMIKNMEYISSDFHTTKLLISQILSFSSMTINELEISDGGYIDISDLGINFFPNSIKLSKLGNTLVVNQQYPIQITCDEGNDTVIGFNYYQGINGLGGNDKITGGDLDNRISGDSGDDVLQGGAGDDMLLGGQGSDRLEGGIGKDEFTFQETDSGVETIGDFSSSQGDRLVFSGLLHGAFSYRGAAAFTASGNSEARFASGQVLVDTDGNGTADITVNLTGITSASQLHASDFVFS